MKLIIDIQDHVYEHAKNVSEDSNDEWASMRAIANGLPYEQRPHGEWKPCKDDNFCKCSECQQIVMSEERSNFCPNCGADMRKEGGDS